MDESTLVMAGASIVGVLAVLVGLVMSLIVLIGNWKIYAKAGKPGWASIVPIYNVIVLLDIVGKPVWWVLLFLVPLVNLVVQIMVIFGLARVFGKGAGFGVGLLLFPAIFLPILGFGGARYQP
jgi:hypothetical protein